MGAAIGAINPRRCVPQHGAAATHTRTAAVDGRPDDAPAPAVDPSTRESAPPERPLFDEDRDEPLRLRSILRHLLPLRPLRPCTARAPAAGEASAERERLELRVEQYGLVEKTVRGDGNCQFRSVADQLYRNEDLHWEVRSIAVERLASRPDLYSHFVPEDYEGYVSSMRRDGTWGDHVTLKALADHFGAEVCVLTSFAEEPVLKIVPESAKTLRTLWLSFWAEVHYNSLYPANEPPASSCGMF